MSSWRIKDYWPEPGVNLVQAWYERQEDDVVSEFDYALSALSETPDWTEIPEFIVLTGEYVGLYEIVIDVELEDGEPKNCRVIGVWMQDSRDFVILVVCELKDGIYDPPLSFALELKKSLEAGKGQINEHYF